MTDAPIAYSVATRVTAIVVNYGTPDLTRATVWALRSFYPELRILVVENASPDGSAGKLAVLAAEVGATEILQQRANIHHGPAMDLAVRRVETEWALLVDSDCVVYRDGAVEALLEAAINGGAYMAGRLHYIDVDGFEGGPHPYVHPHFALVRRDAYLLLPPFERHGAPCARNERASVQAGLRLVHVPVNEWVLHLGEGTVRRYGYRLPATSRLRYLRRTARRILRRG